MTEIAEPLAKFQSRLRPQGRVMIPVYIREYFGIKDGDFVVVIIRIPDESRNIVGRVFAITKVYDRGVITIPKKIRDKFNLQPGSFVEILLIDYILISSVVERKFNLQPTTKYEIIDRDTETLLLKRERA